MNNLSELEMNFRELCGNGLSGNGIAGNGMSGNGIQQESIFESEFDAFLENFNE